MSIRISVLTVAVSLCVLPNMQADSVFNFDNDPIASYYSTRGFMNVNNGISAAFHPGAGGLSIFTVDPNALCPGGEGCYQPLRTLSGEALASYAPFTYPFTIAQTSFAIAFSSELASIQFNFAEGYAQQYENADYVTVKAYNNGVLVGSETTYGAVPGQDYFDGAAYAEVEGVGGFIGAPFNEVLITGKTGFNGYGPSLLVDNIDVSATPEPAMIGLFAAGLVFVGVAARRARQ